MKNIFLFLIITTVHFSCNFNVNNIEIDKISHIDVFDNYEDNLKLSKDIVNQNWNDYWKIVIDDFNPKDTKDLSFFSNTRPQEKKVIIQFRYPRAKRPKNLEKIRKITISKIDEIKNLQKKNKKLILESTKKVENLIKMLDEGNYSNFYDNLHSSISEEVNLEQFLAIIQQIKEMGFENEQREYLNKELIKFSDSTEESIDIIEYRYWQKNNRSKYESFNFQNFDGKMELIGYQVN